MNIPLISGQLAKLHVKLETEDDFELYGGTTKAGFFITPERPESKNEWLVTIDEQEVAGKPLTRFDVYVRQISSGREWVVLSGKLLVSPRSAGVDADKLAPIEYNVTIPVVENAVDLTGAAIVTGIPGPRGWSAYEIAVQNGFVGSEPEWLEYMRQQTATLAVVQVTPLVEQADSAAQEAKREAHQAGAYKADAQKKAVAAGEYATAAEEYKTAAAGEVTKAAAEVQKAAAEVDKAKLEREASAGYATAAAKSAQDALANKQDAEQAAQEAVRAKAGAEQAKTDADAASQTATQKAKEATVSASQAAADKAATEQAKTEAQAAQSGAEEQAAIATKAAADAQAPESIAAQAARPATMVLVRDELMSILGDANLYDLDTDGQKIIVHTDRLDEAQLAAVTDMLGRYVPRFIEVVQYNHNMEISWRALGKYSECTSVEDMLAVNEDYQNDLTSDGEWVYKLTKLQSADRAFSGASGLKRMVLTLPSIVKGYRFLDGCAVDYASIWAPNDTGTTANILLGCNGTMLKYRCDKRTNVDYAMTATPNMEEGELYAPEAETAGYLCASSPKLHTFSWFVPNLKSAAEAFRNCALTRESSIGVLNALPTWNDNKNHPIKMGIHGDNEFDSGVREALDAAAAKGWTVEEVWNGTATVATYSLRPAPPRPVYAKVDTYTQEDGNEWPILNWCHGVTSPDGREPEELGYTLFESVEAAREYFGLPEEPLINE